MPIASGRDQNLEEKVSSGPFVNCFPPLTFKVRMEGDNISILRRGPYPVLSLSGDHIPIQHVRTYN